MSAKNHSFNMLHRPLQNTGVGLRAPHFQHILTHQPDIPWFEVLIDNYLGGGPALYQLEQISNHYPLTFHGVGMSLGSSDKPNMDYLNKLRQRIQEFKPILVSDHLCWSSFAGQYAHDLLPLPYVNQAIETVVNNIKCIQDFLGRKILIENVSSYLTYKQSVMQEWEFLVCVSEQADCDILLDINNIYVSAMNHNIDAQEYLDAVPVECVKEMHLAGYEDVQTHLLDTHGEAVHSPVWQLYESALARFGKVPTLIEWDNNIPDFSVLQDEANKANQYIEAIPQHVVA